MGGEGGLGFLLAAYCVSAVEDVVVYRHVVTIHLHLPRGTSLCTEEIHGVTYHRTRFSTLTLTQCRDPVLHILEESSHIRSEVDHVGRPELLKERHCLGEITQILEKAGT